MSRQKSKEKKAVEEEVAAATAEEGEEASGPIPITKLEVFSSTSFKMFLIPIVELWYKCC